MTTARSRAAALSLALAAFATAARPAAAGDPPVPAPAPVVDLEAAIERSAPAIVSLQILLKFEGGVEQPSWAHGVVVDPTGLVLLSGSEVGGPDAKLADVKVLFGNDPKEWSAVLVARDTRLDLAYVQVLGLGDRALPFVDLKASKDARKTEPRLGEPLYGVTRRGRGFDYAPAVYKAYFTCRIESPRRMWDLVGTIDAGLPLFDLAGNAVAVLSNQASAEGADEGGGSTSEVFALPLDPVLKSLEGARKKVPEAVAKAESSKKEPAEAGKERKEGEPDEGKPPEAPPTPAPTPGPAAPAPAAPTPPTPSAPR